MVMEKTIIIQGRNITKADIALIRRLLADNPPWGRRRLSLELCLIWHWHNGKGQVKDMACRSMLLKLERRGFIVLPPRRGGRKNALRNHSIAPVEHQTDEICLSLKKVRPLQIEPVSPRSDGHPLFKFLLWRYHYLGHRNTVGENMKYLVRSCDGRPLACVLFGSAAWKTAARDSFIGWDAPVRERNLPYITNNTRYLILPWVKVEHLASHILSLVCRRISSDWVAKYGHPIYLLETFVDRSRFRGTCYKAANWRLAGQTKGRTRNDRNNTIHVPVKDVYVYSLRRDFRRRLQHDNV